MINPIDTGLLTTDLDCSGFNITNVNSVLPVPNNLVAWDDPRLNDDRVPADGSVTDASVAAAAGIVQSKLNLNGQIPSAWLGLTATTAAQGSLAEYLINKGVPGGYAGLDSTGKVPPAQMPAQAGTGTVTSIGVTMPADFSVTGSPVTTSGIIAIAWGSVPAMTWLGNRSGVSAVPVFNPGTIPTSLIGNLPASKVTSGVIAAARLPVALSTGVSSASGAVPDPGSAGAVTDYLGRDMIYHMLPAVVPSYQPTIPDPVLTAGYPAYEGTAYAVSVPSVAGASIFYAFGIGSPGTYNELPATGYVIRPPGQTLYAYAARAGYNNSNVVAA